MIDYSFLIGQYDILSVSTISEHNNFSVIFNFKWEEDYGCFSCAKTSTLTVVIPPTLEQDLINNILQKQGIVYEYILKHKEYVGELLNLKEKKND